MDSWNFGWNAITAIAGIVAVTLSSILGWYGVKTAKSSVTRAKLDYLGQRTDQAARQLERISLIRGEFDTLLLPFWGWQESTDQTHKNPDFINAQGKVQELEACCRSLSISLKALDASRAATDEPQTHDLDEAKVAIDSIYWSTYITYLYFVNEKRDQLSHSKLIAIFEHEIQGYKLQNLSPLMDALEGARERQRDPRSEHSVLNSAIWIMESAYKSSQETISEILLHAYKISASE